MFKTARFKIHNPSRHKQAMLWYALTHYHDTLKRVLELALATPDLLARITTPDKKGKQRVNRYAISRLLYQLAPKGWALAPLRDYLIGDATAMLLSHFKKVEKGKHESNPPTVASLSPITDAEFADAYREFCAVEEVLLKPQQQETLDELRAAGKHRVAHRIEKVYQSWRRSRMAGALLRRVEGTVPRPIEFTRPEFGRGHLLAKSGNNFYLLIRLFSKGHRYWEQKVLAPDFIDWRSKEAIGGKTYPGLILPLELGRDFHEQEYLTHGKPQSAKLVAHHDGSGNLEFYVHIAFEFTTEQITTETILGLDRGAVKIGAATIIDNAGRAVVRGIEMEGMSFSAEMARLRAKIASLQRKGHQRGRILKLRGRKAEIIVGEYANRVVEIAVQYRSQIALEKVDAGSMSRFLSQSQFAKLKQKLSYKAERAGLPLPIDVPAAYTSQTCSKCGHKAPENRPKRDEQGRSIQDRFRCVRCGFEDNADDNASYIIALRALHQRENGGKFQKFDLFQQWLEGKLGGDKSAAQAAGS